MGLIFPRPWFVVPSSVHASSKAFLSSTVLISARCALSEKPRLVQALRPQTGSLAPQTLFSSSPVTYYWKLPFTFRPLKA
ncbi:hypothetical protein PNOK_0900300 [Pyrrhoderma noxium]|uniref:Uncharacterized protein n=1 Tax=Pyrrhoderma noxium TaxID=2282107 RepID=A0A286U6Q9_9AGAM|nr:hypothetical protein PNOK_0900300 [Pyrrhoderma noxium]